MKFLSAIHKILHKEVDGMQNLALLTDKSWILLEADTFNYKTYIFKSKGDKLYISDMGVVEEEKWEYIKSSNSILIRKKSEKFLLAIVLLNTHFLILKLNAFSGLVFIDKNHLENNYGVSNKLFESVLKDLENNTLINELDKKSVMVKKNPIDEKELFKKLKKENPSLSVNKIFELINNEKKK